MNKSVKHLSKNLISIFLILFSTTLHAAYDLNMPEGVTEISQTVYKLHNAIFWICVVIGVGVFGVMFYSLFKHRKSKGAVASNFHESTLVEIIWTVIPFLILVSMAIPATKTLKAMYDSSDSAHTIKVTGYQWKWKYDYVGEDFGYFSNLAQSSVDAMYNSADFPENYLLDVDNPMVVPINKKVRILLTANDVIHSWWVPEIGVKKDAIPGFINESWFNIPKPGIYRGQCTELCGKGHGYMPVVVVAMEQDKYDKWVEEQKVNAAKVVDLSDRSEEDLKEMGKKVYSAQCAVCHMPNGMGMPPAFPALKGSPVALGNDATKHIDILLNGVTGTAMQAFGEQLNDVEIAAVVTYERRTWGNDGNIVQPQDINDARNKK